MTEAANGVALKRVLRRLWSRSESEETSSDGDEDDAGLHARDAMMARVEGFGAIRVEDVMVPRADVVALDVATPLLDAAKIFLDAGHSRLPLYRETLDDPIGMVHIKDLLGPLVRRLAGEEVTMIVTDGFLDRLKRDVIYVPPSASASDLLLRMQSTRVHMAVVVDEYGGTDGLVTIEDLIEEIVGEIEDEHDEEEARIVKVSAANFLADARVEIDAFEEETGVHFRRHGDEDVDTLGGLVFSLVGRVPTRGEVIRAGAGWEFEVTDADARRIKRLRVRRTRNADAAKTAAE